MRIASSVVLAPLALAGTFAGGMWFLAMMAGALTIGAFEWARVTRLPRPALTLLTVTPGGVLLAYTLAGGAPAGALAAFLSLAAAAAAGAQRGWAASGALYLSLPGIACLWLMATVEDGALLMVWLLTTIWATDSCAYMVGRGIGGPRLAPRISPGKTWSGLAGGVAGAALFAAGFALVMQFDAPWRLAAVASGLALVAQAGDLLKSTVKRHFGVKDFGHLIPGHGGVLDRIDGLMTAAPVLALLVATTGLDQGPPGWR
ncbi:MAG: phosphatidate cytidylyltransferase [Alphaproteobacteria bacterium]|nr:phosphatidate cytidylyltransferase [Alphaproteobacteria bacterium]